jgi:ABC-type nitrate/sulfonate/bicarbonate transport system substrate-binding protein
MASVDRVGRILPGLFPLLVLVSCTATAVSAPAAVNPAPLQARSAPSSAAVDLRIAFTEISGGNVALLVAEAAGLFQKQQLAVTVDRQLDTAALSALATGGLDVVVGPAAPAVLAAADGQDLRFIAGLVNQYPYRLMVSPEVQGLADFRGKRLGIGRSGSVSEAATRLALRLLRLEAGTDVTLLQIGSPAERLAALENGAIQGAAVVPPDSVELASLGFHEVLDLTSLDADAPVNQVVVTARLVREEPRAVDRLVRALMEATALARRDRELTKRVLAQHLGTSDPLALDATYDLFVQQLAQRAPYPAALRDLLRELADGHPRAAALDPAVLVDRSFVQQAVDAGVLIQLYGEERAPSVRR